MSSAPLISIIIPAYNYAKYLPRAVCSVLRQLNQKHELIVIDDGSTDNTQEVLAELQKNEQEFRVIQKENGGLASVRNRGIVEARADYLIFLDADDELDDNALRYIEEHIKQYPSSKMIIGGYTSVWPGEKKIKLSIPNVLPREPIARVKGYLIDKSISLANGATVMHRELFSKGEYPEHFRNAEDLPVFAQALGNYECSILQHSLARIHKHESSLRHNVSYDRDVGLELVDEIFDTNRLPGSFYTLRKAFIAQRALSLFRGFYTAEMNDEAKEMYRLAIRTDFKVLFKWSYTKKAIRLIFR